MSLVEKFKDLDVYFGIDYSQLEIRVAAQMSLDKRLVGILQSGVDLHSTVGHELTGIPIDKIQKDRDTRTMIKGFHFGIIYGTQPKSLFFKLQAAAKKDKKPFKLTLEQVAKMHAKYFERFSGMKRFLDEQVAFAEENGYVETLFGFRREVSQYGDESRDTYWKNQALNSGIQGSAHQLMLVALAVSELKKKKYHALQRLSMEIHDSTYIFGKVRELPEMYKQAKELLEHEVLVYVKKWFPHIDWQVPLLAEAKAGFRLGVIKGYEGEPPEEFLQKWCRANQEFEVALQKQIRESKN